MLFVAVEGGNLCHLFIREGEVEDADVLLDVVWIARAWDGNNVSIASTGISSVHPSL